jgi:hypothetical protein
VNTNWVLLYWPYRPVSIHQAIGRHTSAVWSVTQDVGKYIILCSKTHQVLRSYSKVRSAIKCSACGADRANARPLLLKLTLHVMNWWYGSLVAFNYVSDEEWPSLYLSKPSRLVIMSFRSSYTSLSLLLDDPSLVSGSVLADVINKTRSRTYEPISKVRVLPIGNTEISSVKRASTLWECAPVIAEMTKIRPAD